jgi:hypothetical protein
MARRQTNSCLIDRLLLCFRPKRFHGTVTLDATRVGRDAGRIADEVIAHLSGLVGSSVRVTLEIEADAAPAMAYLYLRRAFNSS